MSTKMNIFAGSMAYLANIYMVKTEILYTFILITLITLYCQKCWDTPPNQWDNP